MAFGWRAARRARMHGAFGVDGASRTPARTDTGQIWTFADVRSVLLVVDVVNRTRLDVRPGLPHGLVVRTRDGAVLRRASGWRHELAPVTERLAARGLPAHMA